MEKIKKPYYLHIDKSHYFGLAVNWDRTGHSNPLMINLILLNKKICWIPFNYEIVLEYEYAKHLADEGRFGMAEYIHKHWPASVKKSKVAVLQK
jgi:hypothetical protein